MLKTILNKLHQNTLLQFLDLFYFEFVYNAFWPLHDIPLSVMTSSLIYGSGVQSNSWKNSFSVIYFFFILVDVVIFYYLKRYFINKICYFAELHSSSILYASLTTRVWVGIAEFNGKLIELYLGEIIQTLIFNIFYRASYI